MLNNLHIQNYALIENLDIEFESGFSVITGETGAGKSILLGALALILGGRADSSAISPGAKRCVAEAAFSIADSDMKAFFDDNDLDFEDGECIIRRELTAAGKSRAFINDTPVSLSVVKELSSHLIDIHSQHQNLLVNSGGFLLDVADSVGGNERLLQDYAVAYAAYRKAEKELAETESRIANETQNADLLQFQYKELASANLEAGEQERLEEEQLLLDNAEKIKNSVYNASGCLSDVIDGLRTAQSSLEDIAGVYPSVAAFVERLDSCRIELDDVNGDLGYRLSDMDFDPERADIVNERLNTIYSLQKKYHKITVEELLELQKELAVQINGIVNGDEVLEDLRKRCAESKKKAESIAENISLNRQKAARLIEQSMVESLRGLGMPDVRFAVEVKKLDKLTPAGVDEVVFLFSSNKNVPPCNLSKIASGGEIARVMLSLKHLLSTHKGLPTIIFDEIDTGVSGNISDKMAEVMSSMAQHGRQVICITHQPQIAASGLHHYRVYKETSADQTHTYIDKLTLNQRINEIAKMLSGRELTDAAIENAKTLLKL